MRLLLLAAGLVACHPAQPVDRAEGQHAPAPRRPAPEVASAPAVPQPAPRPEEPLRFLGPFHAAMVDLAWSPDGESVAICEAAPPNQEPDVPNDRADVAIWNVRTGERIRTLGTPVGGVGMIWFECDVTWSPDGSTLVESSDAAWPMRVWDPATGALRATVDDAEELSTVTFSPDGRTLMAVLVPRGIARDVEYRNYLLLFDARTFRLRRRVWLRGFETQAFWSADGSQIFSVLQYGDLVHTAVYDSNGGRRRATDELPADAVDMGGSGASRRWRRDSVHWTGDTAIAPAPGGRWTALASSTTVELVATDGGGRRRLATLPTFDARSLYRTTMAWSPDGHTLAVLRTGTIPPPRPGPIEGDNQPTQLSYLGFWTDAAAEPPTSPAGP